RTAAARSGWRRTARARSAGCARCRTRWRGSSCGTASAPPAPRRGTIRATARTRRTRTRCRGPRAPGRARRCRRREQLRGAGASGRAGPRRRVCTPAMRYARRVNESFVDLTYRGLSLGRRIKLTQVRPSSGYLELSSPMPVGTQVAIATDDGVAFDATVAWIYEQVTGTDRAPGMVVIPELGADAAAAWWRSRVALPEDDAPRPRRPSRPSR